MPRDREFVLTLSCRDRHGIVAAVSGFLFRAGCNSLDRPQFIERGHGVRPDGHETVGFR